jgi:hypothetical protein
MLSGERVTVTSTKAFHISSSKRQVCLWPSDVGIASVSWGEELRCGEQRFWRAGDHRKKGVPSVLEDTWADTVTPVEYLGIRCCSCNTV